MPDRRRRPGAGNRWRWLRAVSSPESTLSSTQRHVALAMGLHADDDGSNCLPGPARVAAETGLSERSVKAARRVLVEAGWLELVVASTGAPGMTNTYRLTLPTGAERAPVQEVHGCTSESEGVQMSASTGAARSPNSSNYTDVTTGGDAAEGQQQWVNGHAVDAIRAIKDDLRPRHLEVVS